MLETIANPITFYYGSSLVINQAGHSGDLYNYYWTSYSRGTDGRGIPNELHWHNAYLDGYIPLRAKSIYDPCPYLYRIPSNGTYNQFGPNPGWTGYSYLGGVSWNLNALGESWLSGLGCRGGSSNFVYTGGYEWYFTGTTSTFSCAYVLQFGFGGSINLNRHDEVRSQGYSVRCIEMLKKFTKDGN